MEANNNQELSVDDVQVKKASPMKAFFPLIVIIAALVIAFTVFYTIFADPENFKGGKEAAEALKTWKADSGTKMPNPQGGHPENFFGTIYKGGAIIPLGLSIFLMLLVFSIERLITLLFVAGGKGSLDVFVQKIRMRLNNNDFEGAHSDCDKQQGVIANVVRSGLKKYSELEKNKEADFDQKKAGLQASLEEATTLELPSLERNLPFIATFASIGVLLGLLGTVVGMIKAFAALAGEGSGGDSAELAVGISEALVNTALGITTSTLSIMLYNFFTSRIDGLTYRIDEAGYSIVQHFESHHSHKK
jgi:biopolymer transport protein ExbB